MGTIHSVLFVLHILVGSMALLLFWVPLVTRKGGLDHVKFGRYYGYVMYAVALSGALMAILVLADPVGIKGEYLSADSDRQKFINHVRIFWSFLLFLSLITYVSVRHGFAVLKYGNDLAPLRRLTYLTPLMLLFTGAIATLIIGIYSQRTLNIVFGALGLFISVSMLRYCFKSQVTRGQIVIEHLGAMIGSGIGAYTAFIAFGGRQIFSDLGQLQVIFWVAPGVIGSIAIARMSRKYNPSSKTSKGR